MTRSSIIAILIPAMLILAMATPLLAHWRQRTIDNKDAANLTLIYNAMADYAAQHRGRFPVPGLANRLPSPYHDNRDIEGQGPQDFDANTTANFFSLLLATSRLPPDTLVSPHERSPRIAPDTDYNYDAWNPASDSYWDSQFTADLAKHSNVSYGHLPLWGNRAKVHWRRGTSAVIVGSRGPADGIATADSLSCNDNGSYSGTFAKADGATFTITATAGTPITQPNLFNFPTDPAQHGALPPVIAFTKDITENGPLLQHD